MSLIYVITNNDCMEKAIIGSPLLEHADILFSEKGVTIQRRGLKEKIEIDEDKENLNEEMNGELPEIIQIEELDARKV